MEIVLYHTETCPQCKMVERLLKQKTINFKSVVDADEMQKKGIGHVPVLEVDGTQMAGKDIFNWIKEQK